jgi:pilus assembly protein Flp/PilA
MVGHRSSRTVGSAAPTRCSFSSSQELTSISALNPRTRAKGGERMFLSLYAELQNRLSEIRNERGASAVEYGLLVALIAAVIIGTVQVLGGDLNRAFQAIVNVLP